MLSYQVAETSEKRVGQHELPSLLYSLRDRLIDIISSERANSKEQNDAAQLHFTACVPRSWQQGANTNRLYAALVHKQLRRATKSGINFGSGPAEYDTTCLVSFDGYLRVCSELFFVARARFAIHVRAVKPGD